MANDVSYFKVPGDSTTYSFNDADSENKIGTLETIVANQADSISTINSKIGSTALPTTAQTVTGAISETYSSTLQRKEVLPDGTNLNNLGTAGIYMLNALYTYTGLPSGVTYGTLVVYRPTASQNDFVVQTIYTSGPSIYYRSVINSSWTNWGVVSDTVSYEAFSTARIPMRVYKSGNTKFLRASAQPTSAVTANTEYTIGTLPAAYRPQADITHYFLFAMGSTYVARVSISASDGSIKFASSVAISTSTTVYINLAYV